MAAWSRHWHARFRSRLSSHRSTIVTRKVNLSPCAWATASTFCFTAAEIRERDHALWILAASLSWKTPRVFSLQLSFTPFPVESGDANISRLSCPQHKNAVMTTSSTLRESPSRAGSMEGAAAAISSAVTVLSGTLVMSQMTRRRQAKNETLTRQSVTVSSPNAMEAYV